MPPAAENEFDSADFARLLHQNKYRLVAKKGEGTFSEVLKAQSILTGEYYAIKCMKSSFKTLDQVNSLREIQALRRLNPHPNIIDLEEVLYDKQSGRLALVFELMDQNVYELIRGRKNPVKASTVKLVMYQLLKAVAHMHKHGIFHRDIKPENILILGENYLKVADFGSCRGIYTQAPYTEYISTRWYRAPECLLTNGYYDYKMDIWGIGCVMFEILSLFPLFPGTNELDQIEKIHNILGTPDSTLLESFMQHSSHIKNFNFPQKSGSGIAKLIPNVPADATDLIEKLLAYNPEHRITARQALRHVYFKELRDAEKRERAVRTASPKLARSVNQSRAGQGAEDDEETEKENAKMEEAEKTVAAASSSTTKKKSSKSNATITQTSGETSTSKKFPSIQPAAASPVPSSHKTLLDTTSSSTTTMPQIISNQGSTDSPTLSKKKLNAQKKRSSMEEDESGGGGDETRSDGSSSLLNDTTQSQSQLSSEAAKERAIMKQKEKLKEAALLKTSAANTTSSSNGASNNNNSNNNTTSLANYATSSSPYAPIVKKTMNKTASQHKLGMNSGSNPSMSGNNAGQIGTSTYVGYGSNAGGQQPSSSLSAVLSSAAAAAASSSGTKKSSKQTSSQVAAASSSNMLPSISNSLGASSSSSSNNPYNSTLSRTQGGGGGGGGGSNNATLNLKSSASLASLAPSSDGVGGGEYDNYGADDGGETESLHEVPVQRMSKSKKAKTFKSGGTGSPQPEGLTLSGHQATMTLHASTSSAQLRTGYTGTTKSKTKSKASAAALSVALQSLDIGDAKSSKQRY